MSLFEQMTTSAISELLTFVAFILPKWQIPTEYIEGFTNGLWAMYQFDNIFPIPNIDLMLGAIQGIIIFELTLFTVRVIISIVNLVRGSGELRI